MKEWDKSEWVRKEPLFLGKKDNRYKKQKQQLKECGFCDSETWALRITFASFILPRLKRFRKIAPNFPHGMTMASWQAVLDQMIFAFETILRDEDEPGYAITDKDWSKVQDGLTMFANHFSDLWW